MRREHKKKLTINRRVIVNHLLDLEGLLDYLISKQIFTPAIRERIIYDSRVPTDRVRHLLDYLITRNALAYQYFLEALCLTGNTDIADILEPDYSSSEQCRLVIEREKIPKLDKTDNHENLSYPVTCTQTHDFEKNLTNSIINRLLRQPNGFYINSSSRSASSGCSGGSSASSLSPVLSRTRSSSVTAMRLNSGYSTPNRISIDADGFNSPDQISDNSVYQPPPTYEIDWSHVNNLELDFPVYKTLANLRKQLISNECYQMEQNPRGICLIINNERFYDVNGVEMKSMRRYGTDMDASRLKNLFEKLNFSVEMFLDLKECEMREVINLLVNKCEMNGHLFDAICFIVLSHGTDGYIYGSDYENKLNMDKDILNNFDDVLVGKPKLFIFQACRGEHLNQKQFTFQSTSLTHSITTPVLSTSVSSTSCSYSTSSKSFCGSTIQTKQTLLEDETIKKFKHLKVSSLTSGSLQMMYKKKSQVINSIQTDSNLKQTKIKKTRSRSHSRSKCSYLASAASAIRTAIKTSPNTKNSISTQTSEITEAFLNQNVLTSVHSMSNFIDGRPIKTSLPSRSDFFIWYSSVRGFVSHRDIDGSPFIKCLVTVFSRCAYELELIEMVRKVNMLMQQYEKRHFDERNAVASYFMVPVAEFHLTKRLYFNP
ncbi:unnamed protein product [Brachionus calyciflorus]|uniref:Uncharacterized protein n=1 Tax=Brachionus calyciflorus TaxID=104777 RepID=A0A813PH45_9BILA|nr:unnamed protein product [Brachionus calyciflorus]